jgi:hypothetical protein
MLVTETLLNRDEAITTQLNKFVEAIFQSKTLALMSGQVSRIKNSQSGLR